MLVDYHVHLLGHLDVENPEERLEAFMETASARGVSEIGFADHDRYVDRVDIRILAQAKRAFPRLRIRAGLEFDYEPGREGEASKLLLKLGLDYVIGSVHSIDGWAFDADCQATEWLQKDIGEVYSRYYGLLALAARTGLFHIIGHLDLPKVFGYWPPGDPVAYAVPALQAIAGSGSVVEVNTNGTYKPAGEMYPQRQILERCFAMNIPVTIGSDAHSAENVGRDVALAKDLLKEIGYTRLATFERQTRIMRAI